jgi:hypothetical protein
MRVELTVRVSGLLIKEHYPSLASIVAVPPNFLNIRTGTGGKNRGKSGSLPK